MGIVHRSLQLMNSITSSSPGYLSFDTLWGSNHYYKQRSFCAFLVTLFIIVSIGGLFLYQLINCISQQTVFYHTQINYASEPPSTTIKTDSSINDASYMLGLSVLYNGCSASGTITLDVSYNIKTASSSGGTPTITQTPMVLETCTSEHFKLLPGTLSKITQWTTNTVKCLPLNRSFNIGGSTVSGGTERYLQFRLSCPPSCTGSCGTVEIFTQNTNINAINTDKIYNHYLQRKSFLVQNPTTYEYVYQLDQSIVTTDSSLIFSKSQETNSVAAGEFYDDVVTSNSSATILTLKRSDRTINYKRTYLKLLDVFAYIGGLIPCIFILFFFMPGFTRMLFEMKLAKSILKIKEAKHFNFVTYLKQKIYNLFQNTSWQLEWKQQKRRKQANEVISKLMNIIYLHKRINFLEEAISILLEKHQLKGLHLIHHLNQENFDQRHKAHSFRERVIFFLNKYKRIVEGNADQNQSRTNKNLLQSEKQLREGQLNKMSQQDPAVYRSKLSSWLSLSKNIEKEGIINQADIDESANVIRYNDMQKIDEEKLRQEIQLIGDMSQEELDQNRLIEELENDLKRLLEEGQRSQGGDERSKRICEKLEGWLKVGLKMSTRTQKRIQSDSHIQITFKKKR